LARTLIPFHDKQGVILSKAKNPDTDHEMLALCKAYAMVAVCFNGTPLAVRWTYGERT
jgi:hypothetical protein